MHHFASLSWGETRLHLPLSRHQQAVNRKLRGEGLRRQQKERLRELEGEEMEQTQLLGGYLRTLESRATSNREELAHREAMVGGGDL